MITSITAGFDNFVARAEASAKAARALQEMEDAEYEMLNSVKLKRAELEQQLIKWEIESKDATKSYDDRKKAAEQYLEAVKEIYSIEMNYYKDLAKQSVKTWLESASTPKGSILGFSDANAQALYKFLKEYGHDTGLQEAVKNYRKAWDEAGELWNRTEAGKSAIRWVNENRQDWPQTNYRRFALDLGWSYEEQKNDEFNGAKLVDNIEKYLKAMSAFDRETKKMQTNLNSLTSHIEEDASYLKIAADTIATLTEDAFSEIENDFNDFEIDPIDWDAILGDYNAPMDALIDKWNATQEEIDSQNKMLEDAIVSATSNGMQALTDMIAGVEGADASRVLAAVLQPFAQTMINLGEMVLANGLAVEAFKKSLLSLQGAPAIAAGLSLIALGSALSSGIQALGGGASSSSTSASNYNSSDSGRNIGIETYQQEITVHVVGEISGDKIVLAGQKTLNKWNR